MEGSRFRLKGRVQGVGLRAWIQRAAREHGLVGWVRNCSDGSVEVEAAGSRSALTTFSADLQRGPPHARIDHVDEEPATINQLREFTIRR